MLLEVHAAVQDANDIDPGLDLSKEIDVRPGEIPAIALSQLVAGASLRGFSAALSNSPTGERM
jgi:hypothetical protein